MIQYNSSFIIYTSISIIVLSTHVRHMMREISRGTKKDAGYYREVWNVFAEMKATQIRLLICLCTNIGMVTVNLYYSAAVL